MYLGNTTTRTYDPFPIVFSSVEDMIFWQELFPIGSGLVRPSLGAALRIRWRKGS